MDVKGTVCARRAGLSVIRVLNSFISSPFISFEVRRICLRFCVRLSRVILITRISFNEAAMGV